MSTGVYSCLKCRKQVKSFEELSSSQQLCKLCRTKYPLQTCKFCRSDFHYMDKAPIDDKDPVCMKCTEYLDRFGKPRVCNYCNLLAAFKGELCHRCQASQKKYGDPIYCQQCRVKCAFPKSGESRQKVGDQILCFVCTIAYKKAQHRSIKRKSEQRQGRHAETSSSVPIVTTVQVASGTTTITAAVTAIGPLRLESPTSASGSTLVPPPKKRKFSNGSVLVASPVTTATTGLYVGGIATSAQPSSDGAATMRAMDTSRGPMAFTQMDEHTSSFEMVNNLTEKVASLQKQLKERDQQLMEKEKKATEYKAEVRESERSWRMKILALQKQVEASQSECSTLRRQVRDLSSKKTPKNKSNHPVSRLIKPDKDGRLFADNHFVKREPGTKEAAASVAPQTEADRVASPQPGSVSSDRSQQNKSEDDAVNSPSDME